MTLSSVLGVSCLLGSLLFALTMWRIRTRTIPSHCHTEHTEHREHRNSCCSILCTVCVCFHCCMSGRVVVQQQLRTIQSRDKNGKMVPLHFVNRSNQSGHAHSSKPRPTPHPQTTDDLPYGYVSPADINIPQFSRFTVSESHTSITQQQQQQHYVNIGTSRDSTDNVDGQGRSVKIQYLSLRVFTLSPVLSLVVEMQQRIMIIHSTTSKLSTLDTRIDRSIHVHRRVIAILIICMYHFFV